MAYPGTTATLRAASGDLSAAETTSAVNVNHPNAAVYLDITKITTADGDDEVDWYVQTTYDGTHWTDLECIHRDNADNGGTAELILISGPPNVLAAAVGVAVTDGALADDTKALLPLGTQMRIKVAITGATAPTYAYNAAVYFF